MRRTPINFRDRRPMNGFEDEQRQFRERAQAGRRRRRRSVGAAWRRVAAARPRLLRRR